MDWSRGYVVLGKEVRQNGTNSSDIIFHQRHVRPEKYITSITVPGTVRPFIPDEEWRALAEDSSVRGRHGAIILDGPIKVTDELLREDPPDSGIYFTVYDTARATHLRMFAIFWAVHEGQPLPSGYPKD